MESGEHKRIINQGRDINGRDMIHCQICQHTVNVFGEKRGLQAFANFKCVPNCQNCKSLDCSFDEAPAIPSGGEINDTYHTCPICEARWWQFNTHFHLWAQVE